MFLTPGDLVHPELSTETVVVGAGAAGIAVAQRLHQLGRDVLLIEGGCFDIDPAAQALFEAESIGEPTDPAAGRYRVFGGTTVAWTGRCAKLDRLDLEARAWVPDSGWPIAYADLAAYYPAAARLIGIDDASDVARRRYAILRALPGRPGTVEPFVWHLNAIRRGTFRHFGEMTYRAFSAASEVRVLLECNLIGMEADQVSGRITHGRFLAADGRTIRVSGRRWVLACGGIENSRLLLNIAEAIPKPFALVAPMLGRCFMQHPRAITATIAPEPAAAALMQRHFNLFRRRGRHVEAGFALTPGEQRGRELLNASAVLRYAPTRRGWPTPDKVRRQVQGHEPRIRRPAVSLHVDVEQAPDRKSRILLGADRDRLGLRRAVVDWRINTPERQTAAALTRATLRWLEAACGVRGEPATNLDATGGLVAAHLAESLHHLGGTRMSARPEDGVVDATLRVHGIGNLWVCGGSVMPTGGHANPTWTIVALALRLADHLAADQTGTGRSLT